MNTEQERAELLPCPFCGGSVSFHQDDEECRDGCHYIECKTCGMFDLSTAADPTNTVEDLGELRARIAPLCNRRAALQSQEPTDEFEDPRVQLVYGIICGDNHPPAGEHWVGYVSRLIVDALQLQDKEDAERYRYLSSMATQQADSLGPIFRIDVRRTPQTMYNFDAAIDHARRVEGDGE